MKTSEVQWVISVLHDLEKISQEHMDTGGELAYRRSADLLQRELDDSLEEESGL